MLLVGTLEDPATPSYGLIIFSCPFVCRYKEEARRACRAGKKQLVSFLSSLLTPSCEEPSSESSLLEARAERLAGPGIMMACFTNLGWVLPSEKGSLPQALWPTWFGLDHVSMPHQALRSLKAKQRTEKRIEALHAKLDTVQGILDRIYASQTDQMVATTPLPQCLASSARCPPLLHSTEALLSGEGWGSFRIWLGLLLPFLLGSFGLS